jgi:hypothetical protein
MVELAGAANVVHWAVYEDGARIGHRRWIEALGRDAAARAALSATLRSAAWPAYLWETPALVPDDDATLAEMALTPSPALERARPDPVAFAEAFRTPAPVVTFANLSGDAMLIAPHPAHAGDAPHLAAFVRDAPAAVIDALWIAVSRAVATWLATRRAPVWLSTSGLAVPWLHVRLDRAPKYYAYRAYAAMNP